MELPKNHKRKVKDRLKPYVRDPYACDLIDKMLTLDPAKRMGKLLSGFYFIESVSMCIITAELYWIANLVNR